VVALVPPSPAPPDAGPSAPMMMDPTRAVNVSVGGGVSALTTGAAGGPGNPERALFLSGLRDSLQAEWRPKEVYYRLNTAGKLDESAVLLTLLQVRIRADGSIARTEVSRSSGLPALDAEAVNAFQRAQPLRRLPAVMVDKDGGFSVQLRFQFELGVFRFATQLKNALLAQWQPSVFFKRAGDRTRSTITRVMVTREGVLVHATVLTSAGFGYLDDSAMEALRPGLRLPPPPAAFAQRPGLVPIFVEFVHRVGQEGNVHIVQLTDENPSN
jgi:TonB family protein